MEIKTHTFPNIQCFNCPTYFYLPSYRLLDTKTKVCMHDAALKTCEQMKKPSFEASAGETQARKTVRGSYAERCALRCLGTLQQRGSFIDRLIIQYCEYVEAEPSHKIYEVLYALNITLPSSQDVGSVDTYVTEIISQPKKRNPGN
jgi:hypothetical protein